MRVLGRQAHSVVEDSFQPCEGLCSGRPVTISPGGSRGQMGVCSSSHTCGEHSFIQGREEEGRAVAVEGSWDE